MAGAPNSERGRPRPNGQGLGAGRKYPSIVAKPYKRYSKDNPYNALLYKALEALGGKVSEFSFKTALKAKADIWHIHWPDAPLNRRSPVMAWLRTLYAMGMLSYVKLRGRRIVWTAHNVKPHDSRYPFLERLLWANVTWMLDGVIYMSEAARAQAAERFPVLAQRHAAIIPHGDYRDWYESTLSKAEAKEALGIGPDQTVIANVGQIRAYKNIPHLIRCVRELNREDVHLVIAGKPGSPDIAREVEDEAAKTANCHLHLRFVDDSELNTLINAADLVALPYSNILNSGSAILALSFDRPVLVPNMGSMPELQDAVGPDWVRLHGDGLTVDDLRSALDWASAGPAADETPAPLEALSWPVIAQATLDFFAEVQAKPRPGQVRAEETREAAVS